MHAKYRNIKKALNAINNSIIGILWSLKEQIVWIIKMKKTKNELIDIFFALFINLGSTKKFYI